MPTWWSKFANAPGLVLERVRLLTPGRFWEGVGIGVLALCAGGAAMLFHGMAAWLERNTLGRLETAPEGVVAQ